MTDDRSATGPTDAAGNPTSGPDRYMHGHDDSVLQAHRRRTLENSAGYLAPRLTSGMRLLDIGCGPGTITEDLANAVAPGPAVGFDRAAGILDEARASASRTGISNLVYESGDLYELPYPDGAFDIVHAHQVLQHLTDPVAALVEMQRVCDPDGTIAVRDADYGGMFWFPEVPELDEWNDLYRTIARRNGNEPDVGRRLLSWVNQAGLKQVESSTSAWCYGDASSRAWWSQSWAARCADSTFATLALEFDLATEADLKRLALGWRHWGESPDGWFTVVSAEILARPLSQIFAQRWLR